MHNLRLWNRVESLDLKPNRLEDPLSTNLSTLPLKNGQKNFRSNQHTTHGRYPLYMAPIPAHPTSYAPSPLRFPGMQSGSCIYT